MERPTKELMLTGSLIDALLSQRFLLSDSRRVMNTEKYIVRLNDEERQELNTIVKKLKGTSQKIKRAIVLRT